MLAPTMLAGTVVAPLVPAAAVTLQLGSEPYRYTVIDQDLRITLREFGANLGLRIAISDAVQGHVRGRLPPLSPRDFLSHLAALYGFDWYYDGYVVSITAQTEGVSRIVPTTGLPFAVLKARLDALGLTDDRFVARPEGTEAPLMLVAGPPRYVELIADATAQLVAAAVRVAPKPAPAVVAAAPPPPPSMRVFRAGQEQQVVFATP